MRNAAGAGVGSRPISSLGAGGNGRGVAVARLGSLALKFVAHHLWDPAKRETDPQHGMPADVATARANAAQRGRYAPSTVKRRLQAGDVASLERAGGSLCVARPAVGGVAAGGRASGAAAAAQEQARGHPRCARLPARHLFDPTGSPTPRPRHPAARLRLWRASQRVARLRVEQLSDEPPVPLDPRDPVADVALPAIQLGAPRPAMPTTRGGVSGWAAGRGAARGGCSAPTSSRADLPRHRSLGGHRGEGANAAVDQPHCQAGAARWPD